MNAALVIAARSPGAGVIPGVTVSRDGAVSYRAISYGSRWDARCGLPARSWSRRPCPTICSPPPGRSMAAAVACISSRTTGVTSGTLQARGRVQFPVAISVERIGSPSRHPHRQQRPDALDRHTHGLSSCSRSPHNAPLWALTRSRIWSLPETSVNEGLMSLTATHQRGRASLTAEISSRRVLDIAREPTAWIKLMRALVDPVPD